MSAAPLCLRWPAEAIWEAVHPLLPDFTVEVLPEVDSTNAELMRRVRTGQTAPVLLVAPLSGHFATLLRETARTLLQDHDVYITDWHNARDVSLREGAFGLDDYIEHMMRYLAAIGPGSPGPGATASSAAS